jgi:hypothetical protein
LSSAAEREYVSRTTTDIVVAPRAEHWDRLCLAALDCLRTASTSAPLEAKSVDEVCSAAEYLATEAFQALPRTRRYWLDGIESISAEVSPPAQMIVRGRAWCADHSQQWQVPCELELSFTAGATDCCIVRLGDGALATLDEHRARKAEPAPAAWLHTFRFLPERVEPASLGRSLARLQEWLATHSKDRAVVDHEWSYLTPLEAEALIRTRIAAGRHIAFQEAWLDGHDVLRLADGG